MQQEQKEDPSSETNLKYVTLDNAGKGFGLKILSPTERGAGIHHVAGIIPGGVADAEGTLAVGDVIISINGTTVKDVLHKKVLELLTGKSTINLVIQRDSKAFMSSRPSISRDGPPDTALPKKVPPPVAPKNFTLT